MLRIIVGQDPYPNLDKRLIIEGYPISETVAFWQPEKQAHDVAYNRFLNLFNEGNKTDKHNPKKYEQVVEELEGKKYYFFNTYKNLKSDEGYDKSTNLQSKDIESFIKREIDEDEQLCVHVLLIGSIAKKRLKSRLKKINNVVVYEIGHPSARNNKSSKQWDNIPDNIQEIFSEQI